MLCTALAFNSASVRAGTTGFFKRFLKTFIQAETPKSEIREEKGKLAYFFIVAIGMQGVCLNFWQSGTAQNDSNLRSGSRKCFLCVNYIQQRRITKIVIFGKTERL